MVWYTNDMILSDIILKIRCHRYCVVVWCTVAHCTVTGGVKWAHSPREQILKHIINIHTMPFTIWTRFPRKKHIGQKKQNSGPPKNAAQKFFPRHKHCFFPKDLPKNKLINSGLPKSAFSPGGKRVHIEYAFDTRQVLCQESGLCA